MVIIDFFLNCEWIIAQAAQQTIPNTPSLPPVSSVDLELLKAQIEFLKSANTQMSNSFDSYVRSFHYLIWAFSFIAAILGGLALFIFGKTLSETKKTAENIAKNEVYRSVYNVVNQEIEFITKSIDKERVINFTKINYFLDKANFEPEICKFIRKRGFQYVDFCDKYNQINPNYEVLVLDFFYKDFSETERRNIINKIIAIFNKSLVKFTLVIYISSDPDKRLSYDLQKLLDDNKIYYTPANNPITLMGRIVDAAQMSYASKNRSIT